MPVNPTPVYADLNDEEIDAESPLTESVMTRLRDNPRATMRNDVTVPYVELQLLEGMRTDEVDTGLVPHSTGGVDPTVEWRSTSATSLYQLDANADASSSGNLSFETEELPEFFPGSLILQEGLLPPSDSGGDLPFQTALTCFAFGGGSGVEHSWSGALLEMKYDDPDAPANILLSWQEYTQVGSMSPADPETIIPIDDAWTLVLEASSTGSVGNPGTWFSVHAMGVTADDSIKFRCRARFDSNQGAQALFNIKVINYQS